MKKLLDRPFKAFTIFSLVIFLLSIPVYFLVVDWIWRTEMDDHNLTIRDRIANQLGQVEINQDDLESILQIWNSLQPSSFVIPLGDQKMPADSIYEITKFNEFETESDRFRGLRSVIEINGEPFILHVETNLEEAYETLFAIGLVTFFLFLILVFGFIQLNKIISKKVWSPFYRTLDVLSAFDLSAGKEVSFEASDIEEFDRLQRTLSSLIASNVKTYSQQKTFITNASHELQTPIALLKSKLELLLQHQSLNEKESEMIQAIQIPLARLTRVNKNLLLLAKIENGKFEDLTLIDMGEMLDQSLELFEGYLEERELSFHKTIESTLKFEGSRFLVETLVTNLFSNAIRHSPLGSEILVECRQEMIVFKNSGKGRLDEAALFKRFAIVTSETTSSGLGLAIVKEICKLSGWSIDYDFENNFHVFTLRF
jgi:signal transduction histidine kinase